MCGIAGRLNFDGAPVAQDTIAAMRDLQAHRGPDAAGQWVDGPIGLGHRRLAIIDLTPDAEQPMANEDGTVRLVFNGEIYNFQSLRAELVAKGHIFRSHSDTESLVHLYEELGPRMVERLRGMFAFALWDARLRRLVLARDRVGKKPLFYCRGAHGISFASELGALFADPAVSREPDFSAIHHYLTYRCVPGPSTAFVGIRSLDPGHVMIVEADGAVQVERYWDLDYRDKLQVNEEDAIEQTTRLIMEATRLRMVSDVPLGAFLSGGVDSGVVVAAMAMQSPEPVKTFTIGFREQAFDEAPYARQVAERYGTDHTELVIEPHAMEVLPKLVWHYGNPFGDSSALVSYYIAELTRREVTVALNGDGGDESFGGYRRYADFVRWARFSRLPAPLRSAFLRATRAIPVSAAHPLVRKAYRAGEVWFETPDRRCAAIGVCVANADKDALYAPAFSERLQGVDSMDLLTPLWERAPAADDLDRLLYVDVHSYLPDDLLVKVDIASMAASLELRSPLLDQELMAFAARLPADFKVRGAETKVMLKKVAERLLPPEIVRRPKMGFRIPVAGWFRGELSGYLKDVLLDPVAVDRELFRREKVEELIAVHQSGRADLSISLWILLMLELWFRTYIDRSPLEGPLG